jgi:hypothetical protein
LMYRPTVPSPCFHSVLWTLYLDTFAGHRRINARKIKGYKGLE